MGATTYKSKDYLPSFENYVFVSKTDNSRIWRHTLTKEEVEEYRVLLISQEHENLQKDSCEFRRFCPFIVKTCGFMEQPQRQLCSDAHQASLFVQRIPVRLSDIKDIPYPDVLHLIDSSLRGFSILYEKAGYFQVNENMIGINLHGKAKVWMNQDFSKSAPQLSSAVSNHGEEEFIEQILTIIDLSTEQLATQESFYNYNRKLPRTNFQNIFTRLYKYTKLNNMDIPICMRCIDQILNSLTNQGIKPIALKNYKSPFVGQESASEMKISLNSNQSRFTPANDALKRVASEANMQKPLDPSFRMKSSIDNYWNTSMKESKGKKISRKIPTQSRVLDTISVVPHPPTAAQIQAYPEDNPYGLRSKANIPDKEQIATQRSVNSINGPATIIRRQLQYIVPGDLINERKNVHFPSKSDKNSAINVKSLRGLCNSAQSIFPSASLPRVRTALANTRTSTSIFTKRTIS